MKIVIEVFPWLVERAKERGLPNAFELVRQLLDAERASYRLAKLAPQEQIFEEKPDWRSMPRRDYVTSAKKDKILEMLDSGMPPIVVAERCEVSDVTVYRTRSQARKKAGQAQPQRRRLESSTIDKLCCAYKSGVPVTVLAVRFKRSPPVLYRELRSRGLAIRHIGQRKAAEYEA
jgi:hypothetical protein